MIITLKSRDALSEPAHAANGLPWNASHIMFGANRRYYWKGDMTLSIKWFFNGTGYYDVGAGYYAADDNSYLVLNQGQSYSITIDSNSLVNSLIIFFETGFAEEVQRSLTTRTGRLLESPHATTGQGVDFVQKLYRHDTVLSPALFELRASLVRRSDDRGWLEEQLHHIMTRLLRIRQLVHEEVESLPALRAATREELYRRLYRARDYIYSSLGERLTLADMAHAACLSPSHFLRTFKQVFEQSPHQFLTALRLQRAKELLTKTDRSVTDICLAVGFESPSSFSRLFRRHHGLSPEQYRNQKGDFG